MKIITRFLVHVLFGCEVDYIFNDVGIMVNIAVILKLTYADENTYHLIQIVLMLDRLGQLYLTNDDFKKSTSHETYQVKYICVYIPQYLII